MKTVKDYIDKLSQFPDDWPMYVATQAGGGISIEHRDVRGVPTVCVFGSNGGAFGENPLTEEEYEYRSKLYLNLIKSGYVYTRIHGDDRLYQKTGIPNETCYGTHFDSRIIKRMIREGLIENPRILVPR